MLNNLDEINPAELEKLFHNSLSDKRQTYKQTRPSASSAMCQRQIMLNMSLEPEWTTISKSLDFYAQIGNTLEKLILNAYEKKGHLYLSQWKMADELFNQIPELNIGGIVDAFINFRGKIILYDIKSVGNIAEVSLKPSHDAQLKIYAAVTGFNDVFLQYVSRKVQETFDLSNTAPTTKIVRINTSDAELTKTIAIVLYGIQMAELKLVPEKRPDLKKTHCADAFCSHQDFCWNGVKLKQDFQLVEEMFAKESIAEIKTNCMDKAREYIEMRPQRYQLTLELLEKEVNKRKEKSK